MKINIFFKTIVILTFSLLSSSSFGGSLKTEDLKALQLAAKVVPTNHDPKKDTILYFWATWCGECKGKLIGVFKDPEIQKRFNIYKISTDQNLEKIEHYILKNEISDSIYVNTQGDLQKAMQVFSVPTLIRLKEQNGELKQVAKQSGGDITPLLKEVL